MIPLLRSSMGPLLSLAVGVSTLLSATSGQAAEKVVLKYGPFRESISVAELTELAETGQPSPALKTYIRFTNKEPEEIQKILNKEIKADPVMLDRMLNSPLGGIALDKLAEAIHTPAGSADREALRAALILSASEDGKITLIEALQNYPTQEVQVEGEKIASAVRQLTRISSQVDKVRDLLKLKL